MPNQDIQCHVDTCKYNESSQKCSLSNITVGNSSSQAHDKSSTECDSFSNK
ncbi:MAG: DUF1540 domain-containing protein [Clostridiales bacterium]|jgi:hypothetical protein|nr:DUF1540 domain-containing protein [Clostridiales bacterium]